MTETMISNQLASGFSYTELLQSAAVTAGLALLLQQISVAKYLEVVLA